MELELKKQAFIKDNFLVIIMPISERPSSSGKSTLIATTNGNVVTNMEYKNKAVTLSVNAYIDNKQPKVF